MHTLIIRAVISSILVGSVLSVLSNFIVLRNFAFAGLGITHSLLGGIGIGILFGFDPTLSSIVTAILVGFLIAFITEKKLLTEETAIGIIFPFMMALGIVCISLSKKYSSDLLGYLFGNILLLTEVDIIIMAIFSLILLVWLFAFLKELLLTSFDTELAWTSGVNTKFHHYLFVLLVSLSVAIASKLIGLVLVSALIVIPGATSLMISKNYKSMIVISVLSGVVSSLLGLLLAFEMNIPTGASIVMVASFFFFILFLIKNFKK